MHGGTVLKFIENSFPFLEKKGNPNHDGATRITVTTSRPVQDDDDFIEKAKESVDREEDYAPPPDGGTIAWLQVAACWILNVNSWGIQNMYGVYQEYYQSSFLSDKAPGDISWIGALSLCCTFFGTFIFAYPMDAGYMRLLAVIGTLLQFLALMLLSSVCRHYWSIMLVHGMFIGINCSIFYIISLGCVAPYFSKKRPLAMCLGTSGAAFGAVIYSCMTRKLIDSVGFVWATRATAFVQLGSSLFMCLVIRQRLTTQKRTGFIAFECFKEAKFMTFSIANLLAFAGIFTFFFHFESYALSKDPERGEYFFTTAIVNAGSGVGRIVLGLAASYYGAANILSVTLICSAVLAWCWIPANSEGSIIAVGLLFGASTGPTCSLPGAMVAYLTSDLRRLGVRMAVLFLFEGTGVLVGPPFAGIMERKYGWFWTKFYCALLMSVSAVAFFVCRQTLTKNKIRAIV